MTKDKQQSVDSDKTFSAENKSGQQKPEFGSDDTCRCEEVSRKSFSDLLKLMLADLTFWKKKKEKM